MVLNVENALETCNTHISTIRHLNRTLINWYIQNAPVPTRIADYDPRLSQLSSRITHLQRIHFYQCEQLIDSPDCLAARHLLATIDELTAAINSFITLFEQHYDANVIQNAPSYTPTSDALWDLKTGLDDLIRTRQSNPLHPRAEHYVVQRNQTPPSSPRFCRGAVQVINNVDNGGIGVVSDKKLLTSNREVLAIRGGVFLWWKCSHCHFKLRFHVSGSQGSSIYTNTEIRAHARVPVEYRSRFLIESHLHQSTPESGSGASGRPKYGCLFCFAQGKPLSSLTETAFSTGKDLAVHLASKHKGADKLPPILLLETFRVGVQGRTAEGLRRWDVNFTA
jgi:hypothetical protein